MYPRKCSKYTICEHEFYECLCDYCELNREDCKYIYTTENIQQAIQNIVNEINAEIEEQEPELLTAAQELDQPTPQPLPQPKLVLPWKLPNDANYELEYKLRRQAGIIIQETPTDTSEDKDIALAQYESMELATPKGDEGGMSSDHESTRDTDLHCYETIHNRTPTSERGQRNDRRRTGPDTTTNTNDTLSEFCERTSQFGKFEFPAA